METVMMRSNIRVALAALLAMYLIACATIGGTIMGAGIGYVLGDAEAGAQIGATAGLVKDIWD